MGSKKAKQEDLASSWYANLWAPRVDLIGDIAGKEPFLVHGESLIRHCLEESPPDFQDGFQLLHAVYVVERFLSNLQKRGCDFDIVFFRDLRDLCVPHLSGFEYKYQYARTVIIKHLQRHAEECARNGARASVLEFDSVESQGFHEYLEGLPTHFVLCHDGVESEDVKDTIILRNLIRSLLWRGKNVAIINALEWKSSKAYAPLLSKLPGNMQPFPIGMEFDSPYTSLYDGMNKCLQPIDTEPQDLTVRELLGITACLALANSSEQPFKDSDHLQEHVHAFLLHLAVLRHCTLLERQHWVGLHRSIPALEDRNFLRGITEVSLMLVEKDEWTADISTAECTWDLFDAIDGSLFHYTLGSLRSCQWLPDRIIQSWQHLWSIFHAATNGRFPEDLPKLTRLVNETNSDGVDSLQVSALPFSHPVLDVFLRDIKLKESQGMQDASLHSVFEDLHHWHNTKLLLPPQKTQKLGFFARRRIQKRVADIVAYSASLTNARGKLIEPESIVVKKAAALAPRNKKAPTEGCNSSTSLQPQPKSKKPGRHANKPGGRESALRAAQEIQERKASVKRDSIVALWANTCREIEKEHSLLARYLKALKFLNDRSKVDHVALGSEVHLYLCHLLGKLWAKARTGTKAEAVQKLTQCLEIPGLSITTGSQTQRLSFNFDYDSLKDIAKTMTDFQHLQLEFAAPYMDRRFDSQPDQRVPFNPDAWQIKVLNSIDANNSLLVIAPTSAGKTFISFYAMKKVLEDSDDGVLVYVAPTKALVNQIAAEVAARFTKRYKQDGKSVWAIYTRDYRIQSPTGCQVLVTVPHILQILLLAPTNAKGPNAWSRRIKRIIFDEVHCIGQDDDGVIWEQLLLSAPCPVIALSATIGNPGPFQEWLSQVQRSKGLKLDTVVHTTRYSDLRKFIYIPHEREPFQGLRRIKALPVPGLDEGDRACPEFEFIHPVAALTDRARTALDDLSLEARDCLSLWKTMKQVLSKEDFAKFGIPNPSSALPEIISKADVIRWEADLKQALRRIMESSDKVFQDIRKQLEMRSIEGVSDSASLHGKNNIFHLVVDLHSHDALPALVFHYDTHGCEQIVNGIWASLIEAEDKWKDSSIEWAQKLEDFAAWKKAMSFPRTLTVRLQNRGKNRDDERMSKDEQLRQEASVETSHWESFDPNDPLERFSFADATKMQASEVDGIVQPLQGKVSPWMTEALRRGLGVHHSSLNREYRQAVEVLFRRGYLRVVVATGTLALGINMPCKTVVFHGSSVFLTAQNFRQASGRAGRRGFDLLGNIVFNQISRKRVYDIMSARLPGLNGQFPISTTLVLRLFSLLHGSDNCDFAANMVRSLLSQTRLYLGGPESEMSIKHHVRFSIEYLRRQDLLSAAGVPINFASIVGHLYFMENAVFAFHSLLRGGYFHRLCADLHTNPEKNYVKSYVSHSLTNTRDRILPFTQTKVGQDEPVHWASADSSAAGMVRSPFVALSGFTDNFKTIHELCQTVRGDVFLEESAIPAIPIWPHDTSQEFNAYIYDFYKHGSMTVLVRDNGIRRGEVWFHLKDFSRTLSTIISSLTVLMDARDGDAEEECEEYEGEFRSKTETTNSGSSDGSSDEATTSPTSVDGLDGTDYASLGGHTRGKGLYRVLQAFIRLRDEFDEKFRAEWA
ncbi:P-loop containing nucleoside triphosphate hydrolase protein [Trichoderma citrinoviride]|uniref:P-loop containing nucleoside triphosphate hydrolase protein n=1 Tax=Trichoderma citrinoviride TaxID=58853 RepID=A0A2T4BK36_9HYPO|nr:P-loop containing nucleoside triphosphate hydrolase protein [Trichoderma citrinoviride]PTB69676.1 P-loop containing nucleoside triphosphate hydrolase protein [Trichoderma citrinoviride]